MIGETGDPWGIPVSMAVIGSISLSNDRKTSYLLRNQFTHLTIIQCSHMSCIGCSGLGL
jgi:hypothetical protein